MSAATAAPGAGIALCDTSTMVVIHRMFRRQIGIVPTLAVGVEDGDTDRAHMIAEHGFELLDALHHHHVGEDELVWPKLDERADVADPFVEDRLVEQMESQHALIAGQIDQVSRLLATWALTADRERGRALSARCKDLTIALVEHLHDEERLVLPVVERYIDEAEWTALAIRGMSSIPRRRLPVFLAYVLEGTSPVERDAFLARVPDAARIAYEQFGRAEMHVESRRMRGLPAV